MSEDKIKVAVLFGGKSPEHEVSIITGIQVLNALDKEKYDPVAIYITKEGHWFVGDETYFRAETFRNLEKATSGKREVLLSQGSYLVDLTESFLKRRYRQKIDVFFPAFHGRYGEDGAIQGLFEMNQAAYVGCDVQASSSGMDKVISKKIAKSIGIPVVDDVWFTKNEWLENPSAITDKVKRMGFPVFIKPARLGSSIGIKIAKNEKEFREGTAVGLFYDTKIMAEKALVGARETNISIMGNGPYKLSATEEPVSTGEILSFEDKYISKKGPSKGMATAKRLIPSPIKAKTEATIREYAEKFFREVGGQGMARIDFLLSKNESEVYFNEINTMPGSVAFYLWKEAGVSFDKLLDELISFAIQRKEEKDKLITVFKSNILAGFSGAKAAKKV